MEKFVPGDWRLLCNSFLGGILSSQIRRKVMTKKEPPGSLPVVDFPSEVEAPKHGYAEFDNSVPVCSARDSVEDSR